MCCLFGSIDKTLPNIAFHDADPNHDETGNELQATQRDREPTINWELPASGMT